MQKQSALSLPHDHNFSRHNHQGEKRTYYVLLLTLVTMTVEIAAGMAFGSMALLADGWHMGTHAAAFCITLFAYRYSKKHADSDQFSFGTGKVSVLGGYTSAIALGLVALLMVVESVSRLFSPQAIQFNEAIGVAVVGLIVNVASMFLLHGHHDHGHHHGHNHDHSHSHHSHNHHHDHNLRAAYMHVLADALTSLLAIVALIVGKYLGWTWLDPIMGIVGALVITKWAIGLMSQTSPILLDASIEQEYKQKVILCMQQAGAEVADIHIWKVSADHYSAAISLISEQEKPVNFYRQELEKFDKISHLTIEVNREI
ncbi:CDF family Co(II)/Ni(II) efflux transporter DmeF [Vibrio sp. SCSIO 43137]|uniref:CDF family Co(II)/Ni(II) efflux transporter DmeF n=1 Tax=Vibrio sp. SCSIO 43137 TaxID=3021011 RepID=UPI0023076357|nr:CDF family Co(II)/Ni(II) efflux transporter DmeF [Vibrio sp. SCSIO 43137]WCE32438.1 CDF family Co(II)/Ni(II) efflux transporter DmeF [Vibrio sp. SCSIO 43137]